MNTAQTALDLLRNQMTRADLQALTEIERQQFAAILNHWLQMTASPNRNI